MPQQISYDVTEHHEGLVDELLSFCLVPVAFVALTLSDPARLTRLSNNTQPGLHGSPPPFPNAGLPKILQPIPEGFGDAGAALMSPPEAPYSTLDWTNDRGARRVEASSSLLLPSAGDPAQLSWGRVVLLLLLECWTLRCPIGMSAVVEAAEVEAAVRRLSRPSSLSCIVYRDCLGWS